ncbi:MAG: hypothetical protein AB8B69_13460 [Chitinophagales bacterium]
MGSSIIYVDWEGIKPSLLKRQKRRDKKNQKELTECYGANQAWLSTPRTARSRLNWHFSKCCNDLKKNQLRHK